MRRTQPAVGDVVQFSLPDGRYAYGRVLRDASVAFYRVTTREPGKPPIGSCDYQFVVGVYADVLRSKEVPIVGRDPSTDVDDEWPPPYSVHHPLTGRTDRYERGSVRGAKGGRRALALPDMDAGTYLVFSVEHSPSQLILRLRDEITCIHTGIAVCGPVHRERRIYGTLGTQWNLKMAVLALFKAEAIAGHGRPHVQHHRVVSSGAPNLAHD